MDNEIIVARLLSGIPERGIPERGIPERGIPERGIPPDGFPQAAAETPVGFEDSTIEARLTDGPVTTPTSLTRSQPALRRWNLRRIGAGILWLAQTVFDLASWIILIAVLTAVPVVQLLAFGYLLRVSGHLAGGGKLGSAVPHLPIAGRIGMALCFLFFAALPSQLFAHYESLATIIDPSSFQPTLLRLAAVLTGLSSLAYLLWAWARGGRLVHYLWPQPVRALHEIWRPSFWNAAIDRLWENARSLEIPATFWLGLRGALGTLLWLTPGVVVMAAFRNGETGLAGLVGLLAVLALGIGMQYLPMLQAHFAAENRLSALLEVRRIRNDFRHAPWAYLCAIVAGLVVFPIPLYLLKIEATPREVVWLPCLVFVAFMLPARIAEGLALRRARWINKTGQARPLPTGFWAGISRWAARTMIPGVVAVYLLFVYVSQYTSWDGLATWMQQHAVLIPVPFLSGT
jgi:hypothetical protein